MSCFVLDFRKSHFQNDESVFWLEVLSGHALLTKSSSRVLVESDVKKNHFCHLTGLFQLFDITRFFKEFVARAGPAMKIIIRIFLSSS